MIIVDACAWVQGLIVDGPRADAIRRIMREDPQWVAPAHMPLEVLRTLRKGVSLGHLSAGEADRATHAVSSTELQLISPGAKVLSRTWTLRHTVSTYDAPYIAVAEAFLAPLLTVDAKLARAARIEGVVTLVPETNP